MADEILDPQAYAVAELTARATIAAALIQSKAIDLIGVPLLDMTGGMDDTSLMRLKKAVDAIMGGAVRT